MHGDDGEAYRAMMQIDDDDDGMRMDDGMDEGVTDVHSSVHSHSLRHSSRHLGMGASIFSPHSSVSSASPSSSSNSPSSAPSRCLHSVMSLSHSQRSSNVTQSGIPPCVAAIVQPHAESSLSPSNNNNKQQKTKAATPRRSTASSSTPSSPSCTFTCQPCLLLPIPNSCMHEQTVRCGPESVRPALTRLHLLCLCLLF